MRLFSNYDKQLCNSIINNSVNKGTYSNYFIGKAKGENFWLQRTSRFFYTRKFKGTLIEYNNGTIIEGEFVISEEAKIISWVLLAFLIGVICYFAYVYYKDKIFDISPFILAINFIGFIDIFVIFSGKIFGSSREVMIIDFLKTKLNAKETQC